MSRILLSIFIGAAFILIGFLVPNAEIARLLAGNAVPASDLNYRVSLFQGISVALGVYVLFTILIPAGRTNYLDAEDHVSVGWAYSTLILGILAVAAAMRLYSLDVGIWYDEMLTQVNYMPLGVGQIVSTFEDPNNHILYSVAARLSLEALGEGVWSLRLPSAVFGVASIGALYLFARKVTSPVVALFSVALITASYHHIWFSQNARGYTMLLFFALLSSVLLYRALDRNRPWIWVLFALSCALGALTHLSMGLLVIAQFLVYLGREWRESGEIRRRWWVGFVFGFIPVALLTLLFHSLVLPDMFDGKLFGSGLQDARLDWLNPIWALSELVNAVQVGLASGPGLIGVAVLAGAGLIFLIGTLDFARTRPSVLILFFVPVGLGFTVMTAIGYTLFPRFFFFAMGFGVLIVINGAVVLGRAIAAPFRLQAPWSFVAPAVLCLAIVGASVSSLRWVYAPKQSFEAAIDYVEANIAEGDKVAALGIADFPINSYYAKGWEHVETAEELAALRAGAKRTWVIYTMPLHAKTVYEDVIDILETEYLPAQEFFGTLNGGTVVVHLERDGGTG